MYRVREQDLPFQGSSYQFVGAKNGGVNLSAFLLRAPPGRGPGPHRHPTTGRSTAFAASGRRPWSSWTCISVRGSSKRT